MEAALLGGPGLTPAGPCSDADVASVLAHLKIDDLASWLSSAAMTGRRLGGASVETICARMRDIPRAARGSWLADLVTVADSTEALLSIEKVFDLSDDVCYELVRHPAARIDVLAGLPAHEVANLVALGFYRTSSDEEFCRHFVFAQEANAWAGADVAEVFLAGRLKHSLSWRREHLPWDFATALDVVAALVNKWGRDHVVLSAYLCTRAGWGPLAGPYGEGLASACCALAVRLGEERSSVVALALALAQDLPVTRALQAALAVCA